MNNSRRTTLKSAAGLLAAAAVPGAFAQPSYPSNVIRLVIPSAPGGGYDILMRLIGQKVTESWGQPFVVESRPGASGAIASAAVAQSPADGYSLLLNYSAFLSNTVLHPNPGYKLSDFEPISLVVLAPVAIGVRASLGVNTLEEYIALAKAQPGKLSYGSYGPGSGGHFVGELINKTADIDVAHVPYKGEAPAIIDLLGGQIDAAIVSLGAVARQPDKIKPLAVVSANRSTLYSNVPTFAEAGLPEVNMPGFGCLFAPAGTPKPILDKLVAEIGRIVHLPDVSAKAVELGFESAGWSRDKTRAFLKEQLALIRKLVDEGRVKI